MQALVKLTLLLSLLQQEEEIQNLQKSIQQAEGDLDTAQTQLAEATTKLEATEKQLSNVSRLLGLVPHFSWWCVYTWNIYDTIDIA